MESRKYYLTTPIYYVNDVPHIGHAYTTLACDVLARFKRLDGFDVLFLTGTDEHGQKVEKAAEAVDMKAQAFTDKVSQNFRDLLPFMNISNDDFIRTTETRHKAAAQAIWHRLMKNGHIYLDKYSGWYSVRDEAYFSEGELVDGKAPTGAPVEWVEEPSYFFDLSQWETKLLQFYKDNPDFIAPVSRRNEVVSFVSSGLRDLSISRTSFNWGIAVPDDEKHIMYVWLDALTNYITATGFPDEEQNLYRKFWPASLHMVGKDILRFHAVYWPAFLLAADLEPPKRVFAHGWWTNEGQKISKSLGNVIDPVQLIETYGLDQVRYFLMREVPFGNDGDFSKSGMVNRINSDLANDLGNLCQRVLSFVYKNCNATVPKNMGFTPDDSKLITHAYEILPKLREDYNSQLFNVALERVWGLVAASNKYIDEQAPWKLRKTDPDRMHTVLYTLLETIRCIGILLQPIMPGSSEKILNQLAVDTSKRSFAALNSNDGLETGTSLQKPNPIFPRFEEKI
ncbi:MAG: methionine--tRNA ligase [Pseudomonadota bacterium]|jgi:methionyl-tRNA synthetase|nr:methionine--tRNA ligase [Pseudomonadota bacterium]|tara:strand:- start:373 stop:1902 length:1530 start_codon:yes stop_codon:yes gene_type:complete